jgi:predicted Holliday junction resolvase-like endonuclease
LDNPKVKETNTNVYFIFTGHVSDKKTRRFKQNAQNDQTNDEALKRFDERINKEIREARERAIKSLQLNENSKGDSIKKETNYKTSDPNSQT